MQRRTLREIFQNRHHPAFLAHVSIKDTAFRLLPVQRKTTSAGFTILLQAEPATVHHHSLPHPHNLCDVWN